MILVVGGTGEVGSSVVKVLRGRGEEVTALVRPQTDPSFLAITGARIVRGDLLDSDSIRRAVEGVATIVVTANAIVPRRGESPSFKAIGRGLEELGCAAGREGVGRFVFLSVPRALMGRGAPEFDIKARVEDRVRADGPPLTIVRASLFMESWLAAVGSRLPLRGGQHSTLDRGYWMARLASGTSQQTIDRFGIALLPGRGDTSHAFISVGDVAECLAAAATAPADLPTELHLGGPETLTWREVVKIYERVLNRRIRAIRQPSGIYDVLSLASRRLSEPATHLLAVQRLVGLVDTNYPPDDARHLLGRDLVSVETFLRSRLSAA